MSFVIPLLLDTLPKTVLGLREYIIHTYPHHICRTHWPSNLPNQNSKHMSQLEWILPNSSLPKKIRILGVKLLVGWQTTRYIPLYTILSPHMSPLNWGLHTQGYIRFITNLYPLGHWYIPMISPVVIPSLHHSLVKPLSTFYPLILG